MYPIPSTEVLTKSGKYLWYDDFNGTQMSYIDEDKNIIVHESCVNLSQEDHSQYIPFEMDRYYHGIDLMEMTLQIYFVNSQMGANIATPINVSYNEHAIRFGWLVDRNATAVSGTLMFEVRAIGDVKYQGESNGQNLPYVWKTRTNSQITILKSLAGDTTFTPTQNWYDTLVQAINEQANDLEDCREDAESSSVLAQSWAIGGTGARIGEGTDNAKYYANKSQTSATASETSANRSDASADDSSLYATNSKNSADLSKQYADESSVYATNSKNSANTSADNATLAQSWAVGDAGGIRPGEDFNNAKYWCDITRNLLDEYKAEIDADVEELNTEINNESTRAQEEEDALSARIDNEITRALGAESTLTASVNAINTDLSAETTRAETKEAALTQSLNSEITRATGIEAGLRTDVNNEISRAQTAENNLLNRISSEENRAKGREDTLSTDLLTEVGRATDKENELQFNIDTEKNRITNLDSSLGTTNKNLSDEITRASNAENALSTRVTSAESKLGTLVGTDSGKSVRAIANEELAAQLIPSNAVASMNSLQDIASWISNHPNDAADMNNRIGTNTTAIADAQKDIVEIESELATKANKEEINVALAGKADVSALNSAVTSINAALDGKASASSLDVLGQSVGVLNSSLSNKANLTDVYSKSETYSASEIDNAIAAAVAGSSDNYASATDVSELSNKVGDVENALGEINDAISGKADSTEMGNALDLKADKQYVEEVVEGINDVISAKVDSEAFDNALALKADAEALNNKADADHKHNYIHVGTDEPTDISALLWIDPVNGLKYYDGSAWVNVPMATS